MDFSKLFAIGFILAGFALIGIIGYVVYPFYQKALKEAPKRSPLIRWILAILVFVGCCYVEFGALQNYLNYEALKDYFLTKEAKLISSTIKEEHRTGGKGGVSRDYYRPCITVKFKQSTSHLEGCTLNAFYTQAQATDFLNRYSQDSVAIYSNEQKTAISLEPYQPTTGLTNLLACIMVLVLGVGIPVWFLLSYKPYKE